LRRLLRVRRLAALVVGREKLRVLLAVLAAVSRRSSRRRVRRAALSESSQDTGSGLASSSKGLSLHEPSRPGETIGERRSFS